MAMAGAGTADRPSTRALVGLAIGLVGLSAAITLMFLAMRAVMAVGGSCAEGGPYTIATHCPDGAPAALFLGIFLLLGSWALAGWYGPGVGGVWSSAGVLGWSGLFIALGWNFLDAGFGSGRGLDATGLLLGGMFWAMGIVPLVWVLLGARGGDASGARAAAAPAPPSAPNQLTVQRPRLEEAAPAAPEPGHADASTLVAQLERLATLRSNGLLDEAEYETAKAALVRAMEDVR